MEDFYESDMPEMDHGLLNEIIIEDNEITHDHTSQPFYYKLEKTRRNACRHENKKLLTRMWMFTCNENRTVIEDGNKLQVVVQSVRNDMQLRIGVDNEVGYDITYFREGEEILCN